MDRDSRTFDRDTLLDLTVNLIPLGIMLFFVVVFLFVNPFGEDRTATLIQMTILVLTFAHVRLGQGDLGLREGA